MYQNVPELEIGVDLPFVSSIFAFMCYVPCVMDLFMPSLGPKVILNILTLETMLQQTFFNIALLLQEK